MAVLRNNESHCGPTANDADDDSEPLLRQRPEETGPAKDSKDAPPAWTAHWQRFSFVCAIICCLCAGSLATFSLYAHQFMTRLHYSQLQVNGVSIAAELAMCLPVAGYGYLCDRYSPRPLALLAGVLFGGGYGLARRAFRAAEAAPGRSFGHARGGPGGPGGHYPLMVAGFAAVGAATSCLYIAALAVCAKNFGHSRHRGFFLAAPLAAFGLSGLWLSQAGVRLFRREDSRTTGGDLDVPRYFASLGLLLGAVGCLGLVGLRVRPAVAARPASSDTCEPSHKKRVRRATRAYLADRNMWLLALGFVIASGVGNGYINNVGTIIDADDCSPDSASAAGDADLRRSRHVGIQSAASTAARLVVGVLSDRLAPRDPNQDHQDPDRAASSRVGRRRWSVSVSRVVLLLAVSGLLLVGCLLLAIPGLHAPASCHAAAGPDRLALTTALVGIGYGGSFTLVPILISVVWGVQNFGINWGIVATLSSAGATLWSLVYAWAYEQAAEAAPGGGGGSSGDSHLLCTAGWLCYGPWGATTAVGIAVAMVAYLMAWKAPGGWQQRGICV